MHVKKRNKIQQVCSIKSTVPEVEQFLQIAAGMMQAKIVRIIIHQLHQFCCFVDDGGPVAPGKYGRKKTSDLYILFFGEPVWDTDGIG